MEESNKITLTCLLESLQGTCGVPCFRAESRSDFPNKLLKWCSWDEELSVFLVGLYLSDCLSACPPLSPDGTWCGFRFMVNKDGLCFPLSLDLCKVSAFGIALLCGGVPFFLSCGLGSCHMVSESLKLYYKSLSYPTIYSSR